MADELAVEIDQEEPNAGPAEAEPEPKSKPNRPRGTGHIYKQKGDVWWCQYYRTGKRYRQSTSFTDRRKAERFLQKTLAEIMHGTFIDPRAQRTLVKELVDDVILDYKTNGQKSLDDAEARWRLHLEKEFGDERASNITNGDLKKYVAKRQAEDASNATINRELALLKRAFTLGVEARKVHSSPKFPHLEEHNVRKGFVEEAQYQALAAACSKRGLWMRAMFEVGYNFGCRVSELLNLRVRHVDLLAKIIRLEDTKNGEDRTLPMTALVYALIQQCVLKKQGGDYVFTREGGKPVRDFRGTWDNVCAEAGVPDLLFHDLRRTAVRNMVRRGIPERVAMMISGHKTRSVFDRYNVVNEGDLKVAATKLDQRDQERNLVREVGEFSHTSAIPEPNPAVVADTTKLN
jgi:integrase